MKRLLLAACLLTFAASAEVPATPPPGPQAPLPGALPATPELDGRAIVERATEAAGGETWRRPKTLHLIGYGVFYRDGGTSVNERHEMWRVYPEFKPDAHAADGKVRIQSWRDGKTVLVTAFDGTSTYTKDGKLPPSDADRQWAENFGFGVIRYALDPGYAIARLPDDLVDGTPAYAVEVTDPGGQKTSFWIAHEGFQILKVGFATPKGWHERVYSEFWMKPGSGFVQPGRVRLFYNGVKQNEIVWTDYTVNEAMPDSLFVLPSPPE